MPPPHAHLHLVVPGLLWPVSSISDAARGLSLPALGTLLARGNVSRQAGATVEQWLATAFGLQGTELPYAALRLLGDGIDPHDGVWICADPVHVRFARDTVVVGAQRELDLREEEERALVTALNEHFAETATFMVEAPGRWAARLAREPRIHTHPIDFVRGRQMESFLPKGDERRDWLQLLNEAQMLLHAHPVNAARTAAGKAPANSVWFWGAGRLPAQVRAPDVARVLAGNPLAIGLARLGGLESAPVPAHFDPLLGPGTTLAVLEDLAIPAQDRSAQEWRVAAKKLEQDWFSRVLAALKRGVLGSLRLTALGDADRIELRIERADLWKLWRRPVGTDRLASGGSAWRA